MLSANLQKAIQTNTSGLDAIFTALVDPAIIYNTNMDVVKVNNAFMEHYGIDLRGKNVRDVISTFSCKWLDESRYAIENQPTLLALKGEYVSGLIFSINFLGEEHFVETSSGPIYEEGIITGVLTVWHSIDNNYKIEQAFIKSEELHRRSNDLSPLGVIINKNGHVEYANNSALKMLGAKHLLDCEGKKIEEFIHPDYLWQVSQRIANLKAGKIFEESQIKLITLDGKTIDTEIKTVNISTEKDAIYKVFLRDITSQKKLDNYNNILNSIAQEILSSYSILDITQKAMEMVAESIECDSAAVSFYKDDWEVKHTYKFQDHVKGLHIPLEDEPHALLALNQKKIIFIEDTKTDPRVCNERLQKWGIQSVIVVPLYTKSDKIGALFFNFHKRKIYNHEEIYFLIRFSTTLSLALENSALLDNLQCELNIKKENEKKLLKLNSTLIALSRSSQAMVHATEEKEYMDEICKIIVEDCNQAMAFVGIIEGNNLMPVGRAGYSDKLDTSAINLNEEKYHKGPTGKAIISKNPVVCNDLMNDASFGPFIEYAKNYNPGSSISLPLLYHETVLGVLNIYSSEPDFFNEEEIVLLSELAKYLTQGIISIRLNNDKKVAEDNLKESEERFRMLTEKSNALICELDADGRILYSNTQYKEIFGYQSGAFLTENCAITERTEFLNYILCNCKDKSEWNLKIESGEWRWFRCHPSLFSNSNGDQRRSLILFDISESKATEQQLKENAKELKELNATKDKFFGIIAHDLRNPFTSLIGASDLLATRTHCSPETYQRLGTVINESARKGYNLLQNLLDWSRSQTRSISFKPETIILHNAVIDCWSHVKASALNKHQEFEMLVAENIEVFADVNMLGTIIRNLLQNAVKFTPNYGKISISAFESTNSITVVVEDSGIGISPQEIEKLFRIDVKFSTPGTSKEPGTGLGLLLCKEFVEKHKGKIWVTSTEGSGSKFYFSIPVES